MDGPLTTEARTRVHRSLAAVADPLGRQPYTPARCLTTRRVARPGDARPSESCAPRGSRVAAGARGDAAQPARHAGARRARCCRASSASTRPVIPEIENAHARRPPHGLPRRARPGEVAHHPRPHRAARSDAIPAIAGCAINDDPLRADLQGVPRARRGGGRRAARSPGSAATRATARSWRRRTSRSPT